MLSSTAIIFSHAKHFVVQECVVYFRDASVPTAVDVLNVCLECIGCLCLNGSFEAHRWRGNITYASVKRIAIRMI